MQLTILIFWLFSLTWEIGCYLPWTQPFSQLVFTTVVWGIVVLSLVGTRRLTNICDAMLARFGPLFYHFMLIVALSTVGEILLVAFGYDPTLIRIPLNTGIALFILFWLVAVRERNLNSTAGGMSGRIQR